MKNILQSGDLAPTIDTTDIWGSPAISPKAEKWTYVSFHRFASCPFCNLRTNELIRTYSLFQENDIEIISIWPSSTTNMLKYVGSEQTPFSLVSDPKKRLFEQFGVIKSSRLGALKLLLHPKLVVDALKIKHKKMEIDSDPNLFPAGFLIDSNGIVQLAHYGKHFGDHALINELFQVVKQR